MPIHPKDLEVGLRVRELRRMRHITQQMLADALGVTPQQVQKYERGFNRISVGRLYDIAETIGVSVYDILQVPEFSLQPAFRKHTRFLATYSNLPNGQQEAVCGLVKGLLAAEGKRG